MPFRLMLPFSANAFVRLRLLKSSPSLRLLCTGFCVVYEQNKLQSEECLQHESVLQLLPFCCVAEAGAFVASASTLSTRQQAAMKLWANSTHSNKHQSCHLQSESLVSDATVTELPSMLCRPAEGNAVECRQAALLLDDY